MEDDQITCPCCKENRTVVEETPLLSIEAALNELKTGLWWAKSDGWSVDKAKSGELQWACHVCLESGRAIAAQVANQRFCDFCPSFAYFDVSLRCEDCHGTFVFFASEQEYWYEVLRFWVQSRPKQCVPCRRKRREQVEEQKE